MTSTVKPRDLEPGRIIKLHPHALASYEVIYVKPARRRYRDMGGDWVYPVRLRGVTRHDQSEYTALIAAKDNLVYQDTVKGET